MKEHFDGSSSVLGSHNIEKNNSTHQCSKFQDDEAINCIKKILLLTDSVGRGMSLILRDRLESNYTVSGIVKTGANIFEIVKDTKSRDKLEADHIVIIAGMDAVRVGQSKSLYEKMEYIVSSFPQSNIIVVTIPTRRDLPSDHQYNKNVSLLNVHINKTSENFDNVTVLEINILKRRHFAKNGIHLNEKGKLHLSKLITDMINKTADKTFDIPNIISNKDRNNNEGIVLDSKIDVKSTQKDRKVDIWIVSFLTYLLCIYVDIVITMFM